MSAKDFNGLLLEPVTALPRRPLSNKASTDSCNIRFSLRTMMSGACKSNKRFKRLLRLITRRYKSFKSDVAKRPPSNGTNGRKSGGKIGNTVKIMCSGLLPDLLNASYKAILLDNRLILVADLVDSMSSCICTNSALISISSNNE